MLRILMFLLGMLSTSRPGGPGKAAMQRDRVHGRAAPAEPELGAPDEDEETWIYPEEWLRPQRRYGDLGPPAALSEAGGLSLPRRRGRVGRGLTWTAALVLIGLVFRKVIAWTAVTALSAALHLVGLNAHLPYLKLAWPWQSVSAGTTTDTDVGPWVLQKIEGISRPALGTENFNFTFTHKVSKNIGIWPCWYSSTFTAVGRASATVDLNPGPAWWAPSAGHYRLQVLSRPAVGAPGRVSITIALPEPQLPQSVHDVTVDDTMSHPIDVQHSWTYPGLGCGALIRPQFSVSVLYGQAQAMAFSQARSAAQVTQPLISTAKAQATQIVRDDFVQPTVNALGYTLAAFAIRWSGTG